MSVNGTVIEISSVSFSYGRNLAIDQVSLDVFETDFLGVVGPNGGGKTTLLKLILGLLRPDSGSISVFGHTPQTACRLIGYVPQHVRFDSNFPVTVRELVLMGRLGHTGLGRQFTPQDRGVVDEALEQLDLRSLAGREIGELSGGERQRALVARALACEPRILILDEPTASVDSRVEKNFYERLKQLQERIPIILVSHDLGFISAYVTRVACINRRLVVTPVSELHSLNLDDLYEGPVKMWSHHCEI